MINELVYGHAKAKKVIQVLLNRSYDRYYKKCVLCEEVQTEPLKLLLVGGSGTGKTHLINSFQKISEFPLLRLDATQLMPAGNSDGVNPKQLIQRIDKKVKEHLNTPGYFSEKGILNRLVIFVDEFDKLGNSFESSGSWNIHVQASFLTLIDNNDMLSGVSWIFAGSFMGLRRKSRGIGFFSIDEKEVKTEITDNDILKAGIIPELLGRISLITQLDEFTEQDYINILTERLAPKYPNVILTEEDIKSMTDKALNSSQGVRCLTRDLEMMSIEQEWENEIQINR